MFLRPQVLTSLSISPLLSPKCLGCSKRRMSEKKPCVSWHMHFYLFPSPFHTASLSSPPTFAFFFLSSFKKLVASRSILVSHNRYSLTFGKEGARESEWWSSYLHIRATHLVFSAQALKPDALHSNPSSVSSKLCKRGQAVSLLWASASSSIQCRY